MNEKIEFTTIQKACAGNKDALEEIIIGISNKIYNLSLRMLLFPADAEDSTQEILIKIITHLNTFKGESAFETWVYRIASNYLVTLKSKNTERFRMSFDQYAEMLDTGLSNSVAYAKNEGELNLLEEEVKIGCTHGMLLCLNPLDRVVYILGDIIGINSLEGAVILEIEAANFRKILSRSRTKIRNFMSRKCGLVDENNPCRCSKKIDFLVSKEFVNPSKLLFADKKRSLQLISKIDEFDNSLSIFQSNPNFEFPTEKRLKISNLINSIKRI
jgi:RNA polymerase sigma factor (sigma-70 family)